MSQHPKVKEILVDENSVLFDKTGMLHKEFPSDFRQIRYFTLLIVQQAPPDIKEINLLEQQISEIIKNAVNLLNNLKRNEEILKYCETLNEIENDGDEVFRRSLARLYKKGNDPLEVMKWREIYDNLETALDRCEDVANQIESLVLEYS